MSLYRCNVVPKHIKKIILVTMALNLFSVFFFVFAKVVYEVPHTFINLISQNSYKIETLNFVDSELYRH